MAISPIASSAVSGLLSSGNKAAKAAQDIVEAGTIDLQEGGDQQEGGAGTAGATTGTFGGGASGVDAQIAGGNPDAKLTSGLVDLIQAETAYKANAAVLRTEDELADRLLDIET